MWNIERDRSLFAISLYLEFLKLSKSYSVIVISFSWKWRFLTKFENFRRLKATKFWLSDENYDRQKLRPSKIFSGNVQRSSPREGLFTAGKIKDRLSQEKLIFLSFHKKSANFFFFITKYGNVSSLQEFLLKPLHPDQTNGEFYVKSANFFTCTKEIGSKDIMRWNKSLNWNIYFGKFFATDEFNRAPRNFLLTVIL